MKQAVISEQRVEHYLGLAVTAYIVTFTVCFTLAVGQHYYGLAILVGFMLSLPFVQFYNLVLNPGVNRMLEVGRDPSRMIIGSALWLCGMTVFLTMMWQEAKNHPQSDAIWMIYAYIGTFAAIAVAFSVATMGTQKNSFFKVQGVRGSTTPPPTPRAKVKVGLGSLFQRFAPRVKQQKPQGPIRETALGKQLFDQFRQREK